MKLSLLFFALLFALPSHGKKFANPFIEFELPPRWDCGLEGKEWVCQSLSKEKRHEAIIVLAAKIKGSQDSLDQYNSYLQRTKTFTLPGGKSHQSDPKYVKYIKIQDHPWVDSLHLSSEIPGFFTRYLATIKEDIAVLVTYSVAKHKYQEYQPEFDALVNSLKVFRKPGGLNVQDQKKDLFAIPPGSLSYRPDLMAPPAGSQPEGGQGGGSSPGDDLTLYLLIAAAVVVLIIIKKKRG